MTPWLRVRYALETGAVRTAVTVLPWLPQWAADALAWTLGTVAWACDARGRGIGMENVRLVFGGDCTVRQRRRIIRGSYRVLARTVLALFRSPRLTPENVRDHVRVTYDTPAAEAAWRENRGIVLTPHYGAFEIAGIARALLGVPGMTVAQNFRNPALTAIFSRLRSAGDRQPLVPREGAMLRLFKWMKKGGASAALVDLLVKPEQAALPVRRFGRWTSSSFLHALLAERTGAPVMPLLAVHQPRGRVLLRIMDPVFPAGGERTIDLVQRAWDVFEPAIRAQPEQWMWMYRHWLYLPEGCAAADYPGYARRKPEFDALLRGHGAGG